MSQTLNSVNLIGFIKVLDSNKNTIRFIDVFNTSEVKDDIKDPYLFMYDYLTASRGTVYNLPSEGLNHPYSMGFARTINPLGSKSDLASLTNCFVPQLSNEQDLSDITDIGVSLTTVSDFDLLDTNVYTTLNPGEASVQYWEVSSNKDDPYGLLNPEVTSMIYETGVLDDIDKFRTVVLGVNLTTDSWNWRNAVVNNSTTPIYWVSQGDYKDVTKLPRLSAFSTQGELELGSQEGIQLGTRLLRGQHAPIDLP